MELSAPGVGDARKLARALLRGHTLPTGILVEPLGTDTASLTLRGHLQEEGQWLLDVAPLAATTALGPSETPPTMFFPDPSLRAPCSGPFSYQSCPTPPLGAGLLWPLPSRALRPQASRNPQRSTLGGQAVGHTHLGVGGMECGLPSQKGLW